jgi:hypothetical protein
MVFSTRQEARYLGVKPNYLQRAILDGRIAALPKGPGGAYQWGPKELERASWVLRRRGIDDIAELGGARQ